MSDDHSEKAFIATLAAGRAVLLLGQRYSPTFSAAIVADLAAALSSSRAPSLPLQLLDRVQPEDLMNVRRALGLHSPPDDLVELASQPWSSAIMSAVDTIATEAFRRAAPTGRRLRLVFPSQISGRIVKSTPDALTIIRLFGSLDEQEERYLPPLTRLALKQRRRFEVAAVLHQLPSIVGPHGCLVVVGVTSDDWLDLGDLALACAQLPSGSVHWFDDGGAPEELAVAGDVVVVHRRTVADVIARHAKSPEVDGLERARVHISGPKAHTLTIGPPGGTASVLHFTPEEWRNIGRVGSLLDDEILRPPKPLSPDELREAFRGFLRHRQYVPDWEGIARGFLFQRDQGPLVVNEVERAIGRLGSVHAATTSGSPTGETSSSRLPVLLAGPPASGKSRLLQWLAFQLRLRGHVVFYLVSASGRLHFESVERVCRVLESKGAPVVLIFADGLDETSYGQLSEHLASSGRNAVVLGTRNSIKPLGEPPDDPRKQQGFIQFREIGLAPRLTVPELQRFGGYLAKHGFADVVPQLSQMADRYFLLLLYRLLPDARGNIHLSLTSEYDRLLSALDYIQEEEASDPANELWKRQLQQARALLFPGAPSGEERSPFAHIEGGERAVQLALFCSQIGKPLSLDLLIRTEGTAFLRKYRAFAAALDATALLEEVNADYSDTLLLDADHPVIAQLTLASVLPRRSDQLRLLARLVDAVKWDESAFPGDLPDQDYCVEVLQAVGPRGIAEREFQSPQALSVIADLLARVRDEHAARLPKLLLLEANTLRLLADRFSGDHATQLSRCVEALEVLDTAEVILIDRRPTPARNTELRNVLNTRAVVHGFIIGNYLQQYRKASDADRRTLRPRIFMDLAEVDRLASRSRGFGTPSFYPLDVTFWAYRDTLEQLPDLSDEERVKLLERMEAVLDSAQEEPIEVNQLDRYRRRLVNLAQLEGRVEVSQSMAAGMRQSGDFSGECLLVRSEVFQPGTRNVSSRESAVAGLSRLESFGPSVYESREALDLMNHLWRAAFLPHAEIGGPNPVLASCSEAEWIRWRRILEARVRLLGPGMNLFTGFCLAWALFQLEEPRLALQEIRAVEPLSGGSRRRVGCLVVLTESDGAATRYRGSVRRREGDVIVVHIAALLSEVRLPPAMTSRFAAMPQVGDELHLEIGLNYRGLLPWRVQ